MGRRKSFTMGTSEMLTAMDRAIRDDPNEQPYKMWLNADEMQTLVFALATSVGFVSWENAPPELQERAESLFATIGETLNIEGI